MSKTCGELVRWAMDRGVELSGIEPRAIQGRGIGIFATREIEVIDPATALNLANLYNGLARPSWLSQPRLFALWTMSLKPSQTIYLKIPPCIVFWPHIYPSRLRTTSPFGALFSRHLRPSRPAHRSCGHPSFRLCYLSPPRSF